jgi:hypothetical protein
MIASINGEDFDSTFGCDLSELIFRGAPDMNVTFYRGHRDLGLMMFAGAYNYAMAGIVVQSALNTIQSSNISSWLGM